MMVHYEMSTERDNNERHSTFGLNRLVISLLWEIGQRQVPITCIAVFLRREYKSGEYAGGNRWNTGCVDDLVVKKYEKEAKDLTKWISRIDKLLFTCTLTKLACIHDLCNWACMHRSLGESISVYILTLSIHVNLWVEGLDLRWHSKYTSSPSFIPSLNNGVPNLSTGTGGSKTQDCAHRVHGFYLKLSNLKCDGSDYSYQRTGIWLWEEVKQDEPAMFCNRQRNYF